VLREDVLTGLLRVAGPLAGGFLIALVAGLAAIDCLRAAGLTAFLDFFFVATATPTHGSDSQKRCHFASVPRSREFIGHERDRAAKLRCVRLPPLPGQREEHAPAGALPARPSEKKVQLFTTTPFAMSS
jgi:hypothetical protein